MIIETTWRGEFSNHEANELHAEAFGTRVFSSAEWDWDGLVRSHSLGWVTARSAAGLVGFVNVVWDGFVHAWIQDEMVAISARHKGIGRELIRVATQEARDAGCEWLHVDFEDHLRPFYFDACGFTPTNAGLKRL
jgi:predicted N-acetyltransferase YhbS